jgi:hypothetical protein
VTVMACFGAYGRLERLAAMTSPGRRAHNGDGLPAPQGNSASRRPAAPPRAAVPLAVPGGGHPDASLVRRSDGNGRRPLMNAPPGQGHSSRRSRAPQEALWLIVYRPRGSGEGRYGSPTSVLGRDEGPSIVHSRLEPRSVLDLRGVAQNPPKDSWCGCLTPGDPDELVDNPLRR